MMQFMVLAYDQTDEGAYERRLQMREAHIALGDQLVQTGNMLFGAALLEKDRMIGSILIVDFPSRAEVDQWLAIKPYVTGNVWGDIKVTPCRIGPSFEKLFDMVDKT